MVPKAIIVCVFLVAFAPSWTSASSLSNTQCADGEECSQSPVFVQKKRAYEANALAADTEEELEKGKPSHAGTGGKGGKGKTELRLGVDAQCEVSVKKFVIKNNCINPPRDIEVHVSGGASSYVALKSGETKTWLPGDGEIPMSIDGGGARIAANWADVSDRTNLDDPSMMFAEVNPSPSVDTFTFPGTPRINFKSQAGFNDLNMYVSLDDGEGNPLCDGPVTLGKDREFARAQTQFNLEDCDKLGTTANNFAARRATTFQGVDFCEPFCPAVDDVQNFKYSLAPLHSQHPEGGEPVEDPSEDRTPSKSCHPCTLEIQEWNWNTTHPNSNKDQARKLSQLNAFALYTSQKTVAFLKRDEKHQTPVWTSQSPSIYDKVPGFGEWNPNVNAPVGDYTMWGANFNCWDWGGALPVGFGDCTQFCSSGGGPGEIDTINVEWCPTPQDENPPVEPPNWLNEGLWALDQASSLEADPVYPDCLQQASVCDGKCIKKDSAHYCMYDGELRCSYEYPNHFRTCTDSHNNTSPILKCWCGPDDPPTTGGR